MIISLGHRHKSENSILIELIITRVSICNVFKFNRLSSSFSKVNYMSAISRIKFIFNNIFIRVFCLYRRMLKVFLLCTLTSHMSFALSFFLKHMESIYHYFPLKAQHPSIMLNEFAFVGLLFA